MAGRFRSIGSAMIRLVFKFYRSWPAFSRASCRLESWPLVVLSFAFLGDDFWQHLLLQQLHLVFVAKEIGFSDRDTGHQVLQKGGVGGAG